MGWDVAILTPHFLIAVIQSLGLCALSVNVLTILGLKSHNLSH